MRPSDTITEIKAIWGQLPPFARYTIGGVMIGAVGYLMHRIGLDQALPREMRYRPPSPQDTSWQAEQGHRHRQDGQDRYHPHGRTHDERHR